MMCEATILTNITANIRLKPAYNTRVDYFASICSQGLKS